ncbi:MAG: tRNA-intron lyase [Promethearchaeota archaeon]
MAEENEDRFSEEERLPLPDEPIPARLIRGKVVVEGEYASVLYEAGYYGTLKGEQKLELEPEEALLLARRQRIAVSLPRKEELEFSLLLMRLSEGHPGLWTRFLVYSDLRSRGYVVRTGYGKGLLFRVYPRGAKLNEATAQYFVCAISEGSPLKVEELDAFSKQAKRNRKKLMLAVLDRQGETTYYLVSPADIVAEK